MYLLDTAFEVKQLSRAVPADAGPELVTSDNQGFERRQAQKAKDVEHVGLARFRRDGTNIRRL